MTVLYIGVYYKRTYTLTVVLYAERPTRDVITKDKRFPLELWLPASLNSETVRCQSKFVTHILRCPG